MRNILMSLAAAMIIAMASITMAGNDKKDSSASSAKVGAAAPTFSLQDTDGKTQNLADYAGKTVVLEWVNPGCPFVQRHYKLDTMTNLASKYKDVTWLAIATGDTAKADSLKAFAQQEGVTYPILLDPDGTVAKAYGAKKTPQMFIIKDGKLVYAGGIDDQEIGEPNAPLKDGTVNYVDQALGQLASGQPISNPETKSYGCSVKYKN
jgi:peroxiredoxin